MCGPFDLFEQCENIFDQFENIFDNFWKKPTPQQNTFCNFSRPLLFFVFVKRFFEPFNIFHTKWWVLLVKLIYDERFLLKTFLMFCSANCIQQRVCLNHLKFLINVKTCFTIFWKNPRLRQNTFCNLSRPMIFFVFVKRFFEFLIFFFERLVETSLNVLFGKL